MEDIQCLTSDFFFTHRYPLTHIIGENDIPFFWAIIDNCFKKSTLYCSDIHRHFRYKFPLKILNMLLSLPNFHFRKLLILSLKQNIFLQEAKKL